MKQIPRLHPGEHTCVLYDNDPAEQIPVLAPFIQEALAHGQQFVYVADDQTVTELAQRLNSYGIDVTGEAQRGALRLWTRVEWRQPGELDISRKSAQVRQFVQDARAAGFKAVRFAVEMTWTLHSDIGAEALARWEATINTIFVPAFPASIVCLYNRRRLAPETILAGLQTHPVAVVGGHAHHNCFYEAPLILARNGNQHVGSHKTHRRQAIEETSPAAERVDWILQQLEETRRVEAHQLERARVQAALEESERARREIEASERRFRLLADSSPVLMWITGTAGCEFVNRTYREFFGRPEKDFLGQAWMELIHPEDREACMQLYEAAFEQQKEFSIEVRARHSDGQWRWLLSKGVPHYNPDGVFLGFIGTSTDINERKQAEEASQRLAAIVESSEDAIVGKDLDGIITSWNQGAERIFGYKAEEVVGKSISILIPGDRQQEEPRILGQIRRGERVEHYETVRRRKDGSLLGISLTVSPIRAADGTIIGASKIARDISERIRREEMLHRVQSELAKLNEELEQRVAQRTGELAETVAELETFSYSITHDLRAPLRSMQSFATLLEEEFAPQVDPVGQDYIRRIVTSARRMDRLIQDVLSYSKIARSELLLEVVDLDELLQGIVESYPGFQSPAATIEIERPLPQVVANEAALTQCLSNLIGNAIKFVASGTAAHVRIAAELLDDDRVRVCVQDNGIGIPAQHQERIFGIFQRLNKSYEGTGIGLSIVKKATERMGGSVGVVSEPGKGSTFWLELRRPGSKAQVAA